MNRTRTNRRLVRNTTLATLAAGSLAMTGCLNDTGSGAVEGGVIGALAGMGIGSLTGDMGKGAAAGAIIGGVGGAVLGNNNEKQDRRAGVPQRQYQY